ncbi:MAG: glycosyltransferase family 4 protein [Candidatus Aenigmatarchaeota archaeon]
MKVLMVTPEFSIKETKGLARYSYEIHKRLKNFVEIETVFRKHFHKGFLGFIFSILYPNFITLVKGRKYNVIHATSPELAFIASIFYRKKLIVTFHDLFPITHYKKLKYKVGILTHLLSYIIWKISTRAKIIVANSSLTKKYIDKVFHRKNNIVVISEGVNENIKQITEKNHILTLCFVGNLSYRKRVDIAIKLFRKISKKEKCKLIIVGGKLKSLYQVNFNLEKINEKNIEIYDKVNEEKLIEIYSKSHFLIFPSIIEGFGLPILEAVRCKTLPITFKFSEIPKEVKKFSIECKDLDDAVKKIINLWKNKKRFESIANKFYKLSLNFDWEKTCSKYLKIYKKVANYG